MTLNQLFGISIITAITIDASCKILKSMDSQVNIIYRGVVLPYVSHIGMCHPKGWSLRSLGLKIAIDLAHFGLE